MRIFLVALLAISAIAYIGDDGELMNDRPIIGVLAFPSELQNDYPREDYTYIAASYIKWVEQSGARAMPIPFDLNEADLKSVFSKINGLLFPGGFWDIFHDQEREIGFTEHALGAKRMLDLALQANYDGDYFPIYGIQSGMQLICSLLGSDGLGTQKMFYNFTMKNLANNLQFMRNATDDMFSHQETDTIKFAAENKVHFFYSNYSISIKNFLRSENLRNMFDITSMSSDDNEQQFIASVQGKTIPIYGTQFFAQGNIFEWKSNLKLNHHPKTIDFNQQLANFFVQDTRSNMHDYKIPDDQDELLIYNFDAVKIPNLYFEQVYFLKQGEFSHRLARTNAKMQKFMMEQQQNKQEQ